MKRIILSLITVFMVLFLTGVFVKASTVTTISLVDGVQIRTDGKNGLKWVANITNHNDSNQYGFLFAQGDLNEVTISTSGVYNVVVAGVTSDEPTMKATMINFPKSAVGNDISVVAYVFDGANYTYSNIVVRNLAEVALKVRGTANAGEFSNSVADYVSNNYKKMFTDVNGVICIDDVLYESNHKVLGKEFINDWNAMFGTTLDAETAFVSSESPNYSSPFKSSAKNNSTTDPEGAKITSFFRDETMNAKWGWILTYIVEELNSEYAVNGTKDAVSYSPCVTQINCILNNTTDESGNWYYGYTLASYLQSIFNGKGTGSSTGSGRYKFENNLDKLALIANYNNTIKASYDNVTFVKNNAEITLPSPTEKTGYNGNWSLNGESVDANSEVLINGNAAFVPTYSPKKYSAKFYANDFEITELELSYYINSNDITLPEYELDGYIFKGWYTSSTFEDSTLATTITSGSYGNKVYYALLEESDYASVNVTFDLNDGYWNKDTLLNNSTILKEAKATRYLTRNTGGYEVSIITSSVPAWWYYIGLEKTPVENVYEIAALGYASSSSSISHTHDYIITWHDSLTDTASKTVLDSIRTTSSYNGKYVVLENVPSASSTACSIDIKVIDKTTLNETISKKYTTEEVLPTPYKEGYNFVGWKSSIDNRIYTVYPTYTKNPGAITYTALWTTATVVSLTEADKNVLTYIGATKFVSSNFTSGTYSINNTEYEYGVSVFSSISAALAASSANDVIYVFAGTYSDALTISTSNISIYGPNFNIDGTATRNTEAVISNAITINANNVVINGLKLTGTSTAVTFGNVSNVTIANIYSDASKSITYGSYTYPITFFSQSNVTDLVIKNSLIRADLSSDANYRPFYLNGGVVTNLIIANNYVDNVDVTNGVAVGVYNTAGVFKIVNNTFNFQSGNNTFYLGYTSNNCTEMWIKDNYFTSDQASNAKVATISVFNFTSTSGDCYLVGNTFEYSTGGNTFTFTGSTSAIHVKYNYFKDCSYKLTNAGSKTTFAYNYYNVVPTVTPFSTEYNNNSSYTNEQRIIDYKNFLDGNYTVDEEELPGDPNIELNESANVKFNLNGGFTEELLVSKGTLNGSLIANNYNGTYNDTTAANSIFIFDQATAPSAPWTYRIFITKDNSIGMYKIVKTVMYGVESSWPDDADFVIMVWVGYSGTDSANMNFETLAAGDYVLFDKSFSTAATSPVTFKFYDAVLPEITLEEVITLSSTLPQIVKTGYNFGGWVDGEGKIYNSITAFLLKGDVTVTAKWVFDGIMVGSFETESWVIIGESVKLNASIVGTSGRSVSYKSNTPSIAEVDSNGNVTGLKEGLAEIVAYDTLVPEISFTFYVTVVSSDSGVVGLLVNSNNESLYTRDELLIGDAVGSDGGYLSDLIISSVSKLLFVEYKENTGYYVASPTNKTTLTGAGTGGVDFITFHYAADMPYSATSSPKGGSVLASVNKSYNSNGTSASWHYSVGNDGIWYCQNTAYGAWHAGSTKAMSWVATGVTTSDVGTEIYSTDVTLKSDNYFYIKGVKTSVTNTTGYSYTYMNKMGLGVKLVGNEWYITGHYFKSGYNKICSVGGNQNSIGIESSVRQASDLWLTWQYSAQLCAQLLIRFNLPLNRLVGHHFFTGKNCPQPLLENDLEIWYEFREMVEQQYNYYKDYSSYSFALSSNSSYIQSNGRVSGLPEYSECVTYTVTYVTGSTSKTITLSSILPGTVA